MDICCACERTGGVASCAAGPFPVVVKSGPCSNGRGQRLINNPCDWHRSWRVMPLFSRLMRPGSTNPANTDASSIAIYFVVC